MLAGADFNAIAPPLPEVRCPGSGVIPAWRQHASGAMLAGWAACWQAVIELLHHYSSRMHV